MEKARLTKAQAESLMEALVGARPADLVEAHTGSVEWEEGMSALNEVSLDTLCRALYIGYFIVEPDQVVTVTAEMRKILRISREAYGPDTVTAIWSKDVWYKRGFDNALNELGIKL